MNHLLAFLSFQTWSDKIPNSSVFPLYFYPHNGRTETVLKILYNIVLYVPQKKEMHTGLEWHKGELNDDRISSELSL